MHAYLRHLLIGGGAAHRRVDGRLLLEVKDDAAIDVDVADGLDIRAHRAYKNPMKKHVDEQRPSTRTRSTAIGAAAIGAQAIGGLAIGALAVGAVAIGTLAIGRLVIGRLAIRRTRLGVLEIDELRVGRLHVRELVVDDKR